VQQHDGVALSNLYVRHLATADPPPLLLVRKCGIHVRFTCVRQHPLNANFSERNHWAKQEEIEIAKQVRGLSDSAA
jgi:hypothetical protein